MEGLRLDGLRLLLVDDCREAAEVMQLLLSMDGAVVTVAGGGTEALAALNESRMDAVLTDIAMDEGDGIALARAIKANPACAGLPVIAVTGYASDADEGKTGRSGFDAVVSKPVEIEKLIRTVRHLVAAMTAREHASKYPSG